MKRIHRRCFLIRALSLGAAAMIPSFSDFNPARAVQTAPSTDTESPYLRRASHWTPVKDAAQCDLCPKGCLLSNGQRGDCRARVSRNGVLYTETYGRIVTCNNDPVEKKPLYHFHPGSKALSIATAGCNLHCSFCQNWTISQANPGDLKARFIAPKDLAALARRESAATIAYTYNEPTVFWEYMMDSASAAREAGINTAMISAGFLRQTPLKELLKVMSAVKIDLKAFSEKFYEDICSAQLDPVKKTIETIAGSETWLEVVVLLIPTLNDSPKEIDALCKWLISVAGDQVPLHFSRFFPTYKLRTLPPTPPATLQMARERSLAAGLKHVYIGNLPGSGASDTLCSGCGKTLITRKGYTVELQNFRAGKCTACGRALAGRF